MPTGSEYSFGIGDDVYLDRAVCCLGFSFYLPYWSNAERSSTRDYLASLLKQVGNPMCSFARMSNSALFVNVGPRCVFYKSVLDS